MHPTCRRGSASPKSLLGHEASNDLCNRDQPKKPDLLGYRGPEDWHRFRGRSHLLELMLSHRRCKSVRLRQDTLSFGLGSGEVEGLGSCLIAPSTSDADGIYHFASMTGVCACR